MEEERVRKGKNGKKVRGSGRKKSRKKKVRGSGRKKKRVEKKW